MAVCNYCGDKISLPFRCKQCNLAHCTKHRLPENHSCVNVVEFEEIRTSRVSQTTRQVTQQKKKSPTPITVSEYQFQLDDMDLWTSQMNFLNNLLLLLFFMITSFLVILLNSSVTPIILGASIILFGAGYIIINVISQLLSRDSTRVSKFYFWKTGITISILSSTLLGLLDLTRFIIFLPGFTVYLQESPIPQNSRQSFLYFFTSLVLITTSLISFNLSLSFAVTFLHVGLAFLYMAILQVLYTKTNKNK